MPRVRYTADQLLELQNSPIIRRPSKLPRIESWIEHAIDRSQPRPRTQNGKVEENDNPLKRPSLFETRTRKSQTAEDIFLGPKMSFASASAARQGNKTSNGEDKTAQEDDGRPKFDRFAPRDKPTRDQENRDRDNIKQKPRYGHRDHLDEDTAGEGRPRRGDHHNDRTKEQRDGGVSLDGTNNRRSGPPRGGKLDQPWFRDTARAELKDIGRHEGNGDSSWRERERNRAGPGREERIDREPEWMQGTTTEEPEHTFDDFAKWKEQMKAGANGQDDTPLENKIASVAPPQEESITLMKDTEPKIKIPEGGLFGVWGEAKREGEVMTPKVTSKPKSSRFAGFFAPKEDIPSETAPQPQTTSPIAETRRQTQPKDEDQEGFQRMMNMLRLGGTPSQGPQQDAIGGPPPPQPPMEQKMPPMHMFGQGQQTTQPKPRTRDTPAVPQSQHLGSNVDDGIQARHVFTSPPAPIQQQQLHQPLVASRPPQQPRAQHQSSEPARTNNDSDFLLKLMQQPRASPAFNEGQIYGQNYQQRSASSDINSILNGYASRPIEAKARGPPPGFPSNVNEQAFRSNGLAGMSPLADDDRYQSQQRYMQDQHRAPLSQYDQAVFARQQESKPQDVRPPPGFSNGHRTAPQSMPPGYPSYGSHQSIQQQPQQPPHQQHQHMPQHLPPHLTQQHQLRNAMPSQPPGFAMSAQGPPHYPQAQQVLPQRRPTNPSSMGAPPGYEGYGDMARRGPAIPYPSYLDQRGGSY